MANNVVWKIYKLFSLTEKEWKVFMTEFWQLGHEPL